MWPGDLATMEKNPRSDMYITPCRSVCRLDKRDVCVGCGRTRAEISKWSRMHYYERMKVMERLGYGKRRSKTNQH